MRRALAPPPGDLGLVSAIYLGSATVSTLLAVYLVECRSYLGTVGLGAGIMGAALLVSPTITELGPFEGLQAVIGAGRGLIYTALMALSISAVAPAHRATAMGVYQALSAFGMLAGPIVGGAAADGLGIGCVFYMSGVSVFLAGGVAILAMRRRKR